MNQNNYSKRIEEQINKFGSIIGIMRFDKETTPTSIYDETKDKRYLPPVGVKALVYFEPSDELLNEAGMTKEEAEALIKISNRALKKKGLMDRNGTVLFTQDDMVAINNDNFSIKKIRAGVHFREHLIIYVGLVKVK